MDGKDRTSGAPSKKARGVERAVRENDIEKGRHLGATTTET